MYNVHTVSRRAESEALHQAFVIPSATSEQCKNVCNNFIRSNSSKQAIQGGLQKSTEHCCSPELAVNNKVIPYKSFSLTRSREL